VKACDKMSIISSVKLMKNCLKSR